MTNAGSSMAREVTVTDTLPAGFEYLMASDEGRYDPSSRTITWRCQSLPASGKRTLTYRVRAVSVGEHTDRAAARADRGPDARTETAFLVEGVAAMSLEVVDLEDPIEVGGELTYEVRVLNQGSCVCTNIQIIATAPDGLQPRRREWSEQLSSAQGDSSFSILCRGWRRRPMRCIGLRCVASNRATIGSAFK